MRIAILNNQNDPVCFMDNSAVFALHFYDDVLTNFVKGSNSTFVFTCEADHEDAINVAVGNKIAFRDGEKDYYFDIIKTKHTNRQVTATCLSLGLSLSLIELNPAATMTQTFEGFFNAFVKAKYPAQIYVNEIGERTTKTIEFKSAESVLKRLYAVCEEFGAEVEFVPKLKSNYSLDKVICNVYKAYDGEQSFGMGNKRDDIVLRYGYGLDSIVREIDISQIYTAIEPYGKNDLKLNNTTEKNWENGKYRAKRALIYATEMQQRFPAYVSTNGYDGYIVKQFKCDAETRADLEALALKELKRISEPQLKLTMKGSFDCNIGDSVIAIDDTFNPVLCVRGRVVEQKISYTNNSKNKTSFENVKELTR